MLLANFPNTGLSFAALACYVCKRQANLSPDRDLKARSVDLAFAFLIRNLRTATAERASRPICTGARNDPSLVFRVANTIPAADVEHDLL